MNRLALVRSALPAVFFLIAANIAGQDLPKEIRGYKLHDTVLKISGDVKSSQISSSEASVSVDDVTIADFGLSGISFDAAASLRAHTKSGDVDFLTFRDFRINGIAVEIEEYQTPFKFRPGKVLKLEKPARVRIRSTSLAKAAINELIDSRSEWRITGRVFVFGKFKKFGFSFKRVIPVEISLSIANPVKSITGV